jgi:hypothetical protein
MRSLAIGVVLVLVPLAATAVPVPDLCEACRDYSCEAALRSAAARSDAVVDLVRLEAARNLEQVVQYYEDEQRREKELRRWFLATLSAMNIVRELLEAMAPES